MDWLYYSVLAVAALLAIAMMHFAVFDKIDREYQDIDDSRDDYLKGISK